MTEPHRSVAALDIETDTTVNGLDPRVAAITEIAVYDGAAGDVFVGDEAQMLRELVAWLDEREPGLIVTWNGSVFDLPFIDARSRHCGATVDLELIYDPELPVKYESTPGYLGGYRARWGRWGHLDIANTYIGFARDHGIVHSLKPVSRAVGLDPIELDRERIHTYTAAERRAYAMSDVVVTWELHRHAQLTGLLDR